MREIVSVALLATYLASTEANAADSEWASPEEVQHIAAAARQVGFSCDGKRALVVAKKTKPEDKASFYVLECADGHRYGYLDYGGKFNIERCEVLKAEGLTCFESAF
jgi:hypothetical protein